MTTTHTASKNSKAPTPPAKPGTAKATAAPPAKAAPVKAASAPMPPAQPAKATAAPVPAPSTKPSEPAPSTVAADVAASTEGAAKRQPYNAQRSKLGFGGFLALKIRRATERFGRYERDLRAIDTKESTAIADLVKTANDALNAACPQLEALPKSTRRRRGEGGTAITVGTIVKVRGTPNTQKHYDGMIAPENRVGIKVLSENGKWVKCALPNGEEVHLRRGHLMLNDATEDTSDEGEEGSDESDTEEGDDE